MLVLIDLLNLHSPFFHIYVLVSFVPHILVLQGDVNERKQVLIKGPFKEYY